MDKNIYDSMTKALDTAKEKLNQAIYLSESSNNQGLRQINSNKADWLRWIVYLAEEGLESLENKSAKELEDGISICEECRVSTETAKLLEEKDKIIKELKNRNEDLKSQFDSLQLSYNCEVECRRALLQKILIDRVTKVSEFVHNHCWLDGADLVCSTDHLDKYLLELIEE